MREVLIGDAMGTIMKTVFYDATRFLVRCDSDTPTGIDRVDINYAYFFLCSENYKLNVVYQKNSSFFLLVDGNSLIEALYKKWILSSGDGFDLSEFRAQWEKPRRTESKKLKSVVTASEVMPELPKYIDGALCDKIIEARGDSGFYINTAHHGVGNPAAISAYQAFKVLGGLSVVFYLHDLIPIDFPEYVKEGDENTHHNRVKSMVECGDLILVNSIYTESRLNVFCKNNGINCPPVDVLLIGVEKIFVDKAKSINPGVHSFGGEKYFIYISTIEPRKNHLLLLQLWRQMYLEQQKNIPKLVLVGKRGWNNQNIIDVLDRSLFSKSGVVELSGLSDEQMISILKGSAGLLYPSFEEGWGMPLVEAIVANVPVVCSDIPAHRESGQMLPIYISPNDGAGWLDAIDKLTKSSELSTKIIDGYKQFKLPTWDEHFCKFEKSLSMLNTKRGTSQVVCPTNDLINRYCSPQLGKKHDFDFTEKFGIGYKLIFTLIFGNIGSDKSMRLVRKFRKNPIGYMCDSKNIFIKKFGKFLQQFEVTGK